MIRPERPNLVYASVTLIIIGLATLAAALSMDSGDDISGLSSTLATIIIILIALPFTILGLAGLAWGSLRKAKVHSVVEGQLLEAHGGGSSTAEYSVKTMKRLVIANAILLVVNTVLVWLSGGGAVWLLLPRIDVGLVVWGLITLLNVGIFIYGAVYFLRAIKSKKIAQQNRSIAVVLFTIFLACSILPQVLKVMYSYTDLAESPPLLESSEELDGAEVE